MKNEICLECQNCGRKTLFNDLSLWLDKFTDYFDLIEFNKTAEDIYMINFPDYLLIDIKLKEKYKKLLEKKNPLYTTYKMKNKYGKYDKYAETIKIILYKKTVKKGIYLCNKCKNS